MHTAQRLQSRLKEADIPTAVYYPIPLHLQPAFGVLGYEAGDLPVSEDYARRVFSLPMHPYLKLEDLQNIVHHLREFLRSFYANIHCRTAGLGRDETLAG